MKQGYIIRVCIFSATLFFFIIIRAIFYWPDIILTTRIFNFSADKLPVTLILLLSAIDFAIFSLTDNIYFLVFYCLLMIIPRAAICAWNHHHQHRNVFKQTYLNRILEFFYALHTGVTTNLWLLHHNFGHHKHYLDQSIDESRWKRKDGTTMGKLEYTLNVMLTAYQRGYKVGKAYPKHQKIYIKYTLITLFVLIALTLYSPTNALFIFILPMTASLFYTCWVTYGHHVGLDTTNDFEASYNKTGKWFNFFTGNLGFHTAHHYKQGVHWSELPMLHEKIKNKIPKHLIN